jgi:sarcosine oxidase
VPELSLGTGVKIASHVPTGSSVASPISDVEKREMYEQCVRLYFPGLSRECVKAETCPYVMTKNSRFLVDFHPHHRNIVVVSPCSGHGFKYAPAIAAQVAALLGIGSPVVDHKHLAWDQLDT